MRARQVFSAVLGVLLVAPAASADPYYAVNLGPSGFDYSVAYGVSESQQVGVGRVGPYGSSEHALLWSGTAASVIDLNPSGFSSSWATGVSGTQQVGVGYGGATGGNRQHALLWSGTAASVIDLNPSGFR
jgi:hypothetical protein